MSQPHTTRLFRYYSHLADRPELACDIFLLEGFRNETDFNHPTQLVLAVLYSENDTGNGKDINLFSVAGYLAGMFPELAPSQLSHLMELSWEPFEEADVPKSIVTDMGHYHMRRAGMVGTWSVKQVPDSMDFLSNLALVGIKAADPATLMERVAVKAGTLKKFLWRD